jgi:sugar O-acyltransferase (sialic acid O-acetyltransferase NeuD family)
MILYGASGHGKVILDILECSGVHPIEIWDDNPPLSFCGYKVVKPEPELNQYKQKIVIGIGVNETRKKVVAKLDKSITFGNAIHPSAIISKHSNIGEGTVVMAGAVVNPATTVGKHCIINTSASIDHDCELGDFVHISPNATLSGNVRVGEGTHIGSGAVSIQGIRIGKWCTIGAGAVVIRDIPDYATVVGNPGKVIKVKERVDEF